MNAQKGAVQAVRFGRIYMGGLFGWMMNIWDLTIMVLLVVPISSLFFPGINEYFAITGTISIYLATSVFRAAGGFIFGRLGDIIGRKKSMEITLIGIGVSSLLTGLIPTYSQAGILSFVLLVILRIATGLFAGGEYGNSAVIVVENAPKNRRGVWGALTQIGFPIGFILAASTYLIVLSIVGANNFATPSYTAGWRMVFWIGIIPAIAGLIIRASLPESPLWEKMKENRGIENSPLRSLFGNKITRNTFINSWIGMTGFALAYWLTAGFLPTLLPTYAKTSSALSLMILMVALASSLFAYIIVGAVSDRIGRKKAIYIFSILGAAFALPTLYLILNPGSSLLIIALSASVLTFTATGVWGIFPVYLSEKFPTQLRDTGVGSTFNSGFIIGAWGSTFALMLAGADPHKYLLWAAGGLIILGLIIAASSVFFAKETREAEM